MKAPITSIVTLHALATQAQQLNRMTNVLGWNYTSLKNLRNQETVSTIGSFRVNANNAMDWIQRDGEREFTFTVTCRAGTWHDVTVNGCLIYTVTYETSQGTIKISRTATGPLIEMDIDNPTRPNTQYSFIISPVQITTN